jgi:hypothetical protein
MNKWKIAFYITMVVFLLALGFFLGRKTVKEPETQIVTEYIEGEKITDTLYYPKPYKVVVPADTLGIIQQCIKDGIYKELWPEKVVTEYIEVNKSVSDTISALREISGRGRDTFPENTVISLSCSKKGKIRVSMYRTDITSYKFRARGDNMYPLYYVYGQHCFDRKL